MSDYVQPATIAATAIVSIAIGFGAATWLASDADANKPIINPTAWEETAPAPQVQTVSLTNTAKPAAIAKCSPWEVSDVAMEEMLDEMIARGWRPPNQGEAIAAMGVSSIAATDPYAPMPYRRTWAPLDPNAEAAPVDANGQPITEPALAATGASSAPSPGASPQPVAIDQPPVSPPADS